MVAEERKGSQFVLKGVVRNRPRLQQAIEHSLGVISNMGHYQAFPVGSMNHYPTIAANVIGADVLKFLPGDTAGRAAPFEQTLSVKDQRFGPVGQHQGNKEESETESRPARPVGGAEGHQEAGSKRHDNHSTTQRPVL